MLWQLSAGLAEATTHQNEIQTAADLRQEARATLDYIIEHIPEGELRTSFEALPEVKQLYR